VGVRHHELDTGESAGLQRAEERGPKGAVLAVTNIQPEDLAAAVGSHAGGGHDRSGDDPSVDAGLEVGGVQEHIREGGMGKRAGPERLDLLVQLATDPADLTLGDAAVDAQGLDQVVDLAGRGAVSIGLHDDRQQGPVDAAARSSSAGKNAPSRSLGILSWTSPALVDSSRERVPLRWAVRVSVRSCRPAPMCWVASVSIRACSTRARLSR
jgi:hypothetical protein